jgi:hypothetical protein
VKNFFFSYKNTKYFINTLPGQLADLKNWGISWHKLDNRENLAENAPIFYALDGGK